MSFVGEAPRVPLFCQHSLTFPEFNEKSFYCESLEKSSFTTKAYLKLLNKMYRQQTDTEIGT